MSTSEYAFFTAGQPQRLKLTDPTAVEPRGLRSDEGTGTTPAAALLRSAALLSRRPTRFLSAPRLLWEAPGPLWLIPTETFIVEGGKSIVLQALRRDHGVEVVAEGSHGKVLLRVPGETQDRVRKAFELAHETWRTGAVRAAHPNFVRAALRPPLARLSASAPWHLHNDGSLGQAGADVRAAQAWSLSRGSLDVQVAVLGEGVDHVHPDLLGAVRRERDFVDGRLHARPDPGDAHSTAAAGLVASRSERFPGLAPQASIMVARVARGELGHYVADDFDVADAIDWAWGQGADVVLLGWSGGPRVDAIDRALERARRRGRRGKGCVLVAPVGDGEQAVAYPANAEGVLAVGASNPWDERKTRRSRDAESSWGSNAGPELGLLAPGVALTTTDNRGWTGLSQQDHTGSFSGTAGAAALVAAAAALVLTLAPRCDEATVRKLLRAGADPLPGQKGWTAQLGEGRLNAHATLRLAARP